jgi:hypothetical protein
MVRGADRAYLEKKVGGCHDREAVRGCGSIRQTATQRDENAHVVRFVENHIVTTEQFARPL